MKQKQKQQFKLINNSLNTIAQNQALLYLKLEKLETSLKQLSMKSPADPKQIKP